MQNVIENPDAVYQALKQRKSKHTCISMGEADWTLLVGTYPDLETTTTLLTGKKELEGEIIMYSLNGVKLYFYTMESLSLYCFENALVATSVDTQS